MRAVLIVNPHATSTTERRRDLLAHALAGEIDVRLEHTMGRGHAADLAAKAAEEHYDLVVVHGGDGTVNEVVNGLLRHGPGAAGPVLSVVPGGSTNVFARAVGMAADPTAATEQILEALAEGRAPRTVSLGQAGDRYFTFNAGIGIDADVVERVEAKRAKGAKVTNALHIRQTVRAWLAADRKNPPLTVTVDDREPVPGCHLVFVTNVDPWTYLGARPVRTNPGVTAEGGLGVMAVTSLQPPTVARMVSQLLRPNSGKGVHGKHVVRFDDVSRIRVDATDPVGLQMDGDDVGKWNPVEFVSVPEALRVLV